MLKMYELFNIVYIYMRSFRCLRHVCFLLIWYQAPNLAFDLGTGVAGSITFQFFHFILLLWEFSSISSFKSKTKPSLSPVSYCFSYGICFLTFKTHLGLLSWASSFASYDTNQTSVSVCNELRHQNIAIFLHKKRGWKMKK